MGANKKDGGKALTPGRFRAMARVATRQHEQRYPHVLLRSKKVESGIIHQINRQNRPGKALLSILATTGSRVVCIHPDYMRDDSDDSPAVKENALKNALEAILRNHRETRHAATPAKWHGEIVNFMSRNGTELTCCHEGASVYIGEVVRQSGGDDPSWDARDLTQISVDEAAEIVQILKDMPAYERRLGEKFATPVLKISADELTNVIF